MQVVIFSRRFKVLNRKGIPNLWTFVKNCDFFQICSAMMHAIITGYSASYLLDEVGQNIVICQCLADQLFASAFGFGK